MARGLFSTSDNGMLTFVEGSTKPDRQLVWFDRNGKQVDAVPGMDGYASPRISRDGKGLVFYLDASGYDVWTYDLGRGVKMAQTFGTASAQLNLFPVWSPDDKRIAYASYHERKYFIQQKASDGSSGAEVLLDGTEQYRWPSDWSPD